MNPRWLMKMALWARNPPSKRRIQIVIFAVVCTAILYGFEQYFGWPEALTAEKIGNKGLR
ncbi:MAG: hypothetical protein JXQ85_12345 [Cognatishimia sp.]|uniref:hypothetical protein n=1 Tax=Cognatishimia sp. TaxID=2211648 RepID=UPI003B8D4EF1